MGQTMAEKIFSKKSGQRVTAGDTIIADIDLCMATDASAPLTLEIYQDIKADIKEEINKTVFVFDHYVPSPNDKVTRLQEKVRKFSEAHNGNLIEIGEGVCHQLLAEKAYVKPGELIIGADSHTCTYGALNAAATGVGSTDIACAMATGKLWFDVPETIKINLSGNLKKGVFSKDLSLYIIKLLGAGGANYRAIEFQGNALKNLSISERMTISNMMVEAGAKFVFMPFDKITKKHFENEKIDISNNEAIFPGADADYIKVIDINLEKVIPLIACPHRVDNIKPLNEIKGKNIDMVFLGTCTNGRYEDFEIVYQILENHNINFGVQVLVAPSSRKIYNKMIKEGIMELFISKGLIVLPPSCGPCCGSSAGVPGDNQNVISTANRNFKGRMGNVKSDIYLASPAAAIVAAITGKITDPGGFI